MKRIIKKIILSAVCVVLVFAHARVAIHAETNTCTVTFFASYETEPETVVVNGGTLVEKPNDPERQYYEFAGWYKDSAYTEAWDFENDLVMNDMTLYAKWNYHLLKLGIGGDGFGRIADAAPGEELVMEEEYRITSAFSVIPGVHKIAARAEEGSEFVEWRYEDGRTYSTDAETTVELGDENITLNAIFKILPYETATLSLKNGVSAELYPTLPLDGVLEVLFTAGELSVVEMDPIVGAESLVLVQDKDGKLVYIYDTESERFAYGSEYHNISYDITDELRNRIQQNIKEYPDNYYPEMHYALQN
ncbi:MAG: InlB B-repeat-containing protein, partial [Solobacterium sp.]|nr:InlB B-repeat-containing protein [Solobacterium sp.]